MAEKRKERESKTKEKSLTKSLTKMKSKDDEVHICGTDIQALHSYSVHNTSFATLPDSTPSTPDPKKGKHEPSLSEIQENIVRCINERVNGLEELLRANTVSIEALKKTTEFLFNEVKDVKEDMKNVKEEMKINHEVSGAHGKKISEIEARLNEVEHYKRRWNLRMYGLVEQAGEDIKARVVDICCAVLPELTSKLQQDVDIVHRLGRKLEGNAVKARTVIIQFVSRSSRDMLWKAAKTSSYLKTKEIRFGEDLTTMDKAVRKQLWPKVEAARQFSPVFPGPGGL
ncbi:uncharacterized protein si:ch211-196c10.15 [Myxocyprinus asiaticus]|uniref:uncharacterized protein si:ch211-196c10.15 n=1 Tax=Myxocyprinus asiaticus TaxID=70543 RepID=UPI0022212BE9|nr:uncharacterized protein si:ch211-196c10.15 [Myxocyprinus asiaticus]